MWHLEKLERAAQVLDNLGDLLGSAGGLGALLGGLVAAVATVLVIAYTTLFSPFWIKLFYRLYGDRPELIESADERPLGRQ